MQAPQSKSYFARRAAEERAAAELASDECAAEAHRALAERYDDLASGATLDALTAAPNGPKILPHPFRILP